MTKQCSFSENALSQFVDLASRALHDAQKLGHHLDPTTLTGFIGSLLYIKKLGYSYEGSWIETPAAYAQSVMESNMGLDLPDPIRRAVYYFHHDILKIGKPDIFLDIIRFIDECPFEVADYLILFDFVAQKLSDDSPKYHTEFYTPRTLCNLMCSLVDNSAHSVYNPFAGSMSFATEMKEYDTFIGVEISHDTYHIAVLRIALAEIEHKAKVEMADVMTVGEGNFDVIIANPPFRARLEPQYDIVYPGERYIDSDTYVWRVFEKFARPDGMAVSLVVSSLLYEERGSSMQLRKELLEKGYLHAVIALPSGTIPGTNIAVSCVVLKKHNCDEPITMVDASSMFRMEGRRKVVDVDSILNAYHNEVEGISRKVTRSEIAESLSWFPAKYVSVEEKCPEGYEYRLLRELASESYFEHFDAANESGLAITISDLSREWQSCDIDKSSLQVESNLRAYNKLVNDAVLVSTVRDLKPSFVHASEDEPVYIKRNIIALVPNAKVDAHFLCMALANLSPQFVGAGAPSISRSRLMSEKIAIPDIETQISAYNEAKKAALVAKAREMGLQDLIKQMKDEYINEVRLRKHDLMPYTRELGSIQRRMSRILESCDDISELKEKLSDKLDKQAQAIASLTSMLEDLSREEVFGTPELFNLDEYFYNLEVNHDDDTGFDLTYDADESALKEYGLPCHNTKGIFKDYLGGLVSIKATLQNAPDDIIELLTKIAPNDFERLVNNIIKNAAKHGFVDEDRDDYEINIYLSVDSERHMFQIDFRNNGLPFPLGLTKERYGRQGDSAGKTAGSGSGGHIVKKIVEHYGGDYDLIREDKMSTIRIWLPIENTIADEEV